MLRKIVNFSNVITIILSLCAFSSTGTTQDEALRLDGPAPYNPETEPDIDMYMSNWKDSVSFHTHGSLIEREVGLGYSLSCSLH